MIDAHAHPAPSTCGSHDICAASCQPLDWKPLLHNTRLFRVGIGVHPWWIDRVSLSLEEIDRLLVKHPNTFVGEIGLDRSSRYKHSYANQRIAFEQQLAMAKTHQRPVVVHLVRSTEIGIRLLKKYDIPSVYLHGFMCSIEVIQQLPSFFFGFNRRNAFHPKGITMLKNLYPEQILLESDGLSEPDELEQILAQIARILGISFEAAESLTRHNTMKWLDNS